LKFPHPSIEGQAAQGTERLVLEQIHEARWPARVAKFWERPNFPIRQSLQQFVELLIPYSPLIPIPLVFFVSDTYKMSASLRTIAPFLRTARHSLRQNSSPLVSLQRQTRTPVLNFARTYAVYERTKPHVNIGM
jgi:hypothetical protein